MKIIYFFLFYSFLCIEFDFVSYYSKNCKNLAQNLDCTTFNVTFWNNGTSIWLGIANVFKMGIWRSNITINKYDILQNYLIENGIMNLSSSYGPQNDYNNLIELVILENNGNFKNILHRNTLISANQQLNLIESEMKKYLDEANWENGTDVINSGSEIESFSIFLSACFGICESYDITFNSNGNVIWHGYSNTNKKGIWKVWKPDMIFL